MENIANKTVIITGASSGLGAETARYLVKNGAHVILGARRLDRLQQLADELGISHDHCVQTDVADLAQVQALAQRALDLYGRIDVLLNNAGVMPLSLLEEQKVDEWNQTIDINIRGVLHGIAAVLAQCDAKDGLKDGIINAWENCDYDPAGLDLPQEKIAALKAIFEGAKNSHGEPIYRGWYYDSGINQPNWRAWKLGTAQDGKPNANNIILGSGSLTQYFMTPYNPGFDLEHFDFDRDPAKTYQTGALNDAISTDLSTYRAGGGKLLVITGVSDPVFSAKDQRDWFAQLQQDTAGTDSFARLYMVPGMTHCGGGNAYSDFDPLTALEQWHDHNTAPEQLTATHANGKQMPLCAWPKIATYTGGDESKAASYQCR